MKYSAALIKHGVMLLVVVLHLTPVAAQQDYKSRVDIVYKDIYQYFYDSSKNLFIEKTVLKKDEKPYSYLWPICALIQAANEVEILNPGKEYMKPVMQVIDKYYNSKKPPHPGYESYLMEAGGDGRFFDDNQWIGIAYLDAYQRTKATTYLDLAKDIYQFTLTGYDIIAGGGLYWKEFDSTTKNTCSNGPEVLMALQLYKITKEKKYLDTAMLIHDWVNKNLRSPEGLYYDNIMLPSLKIDQRIYTYNTGTMLQSDVLLYQITGKEKYLASAKKIAASALNYFFKDDLFPDNYWFNAVLLRGYVELYKVDKERKYMAAFKTYADKVWNTQRDERNLVGTRKIKSLIDQAAYLEIIARLQQYNN
jgi:rhamnogalacturonyl hydrolase YesR